MAFEKFSDIPIRANGQKIDASWFNSIRLLLIQIFGDIAGEKQTIIGNTDTNQDILGLENISSNEFSRVDVDYMVRRKDDGNDLFQTGTFYLHYKTSSNTWALLGADENLVGDDAQIEFSLFTQDVSGDLQTTARYSTTDIGGGGVHTADLKVRSIKWII